MNRNEMFHLLFPIQDGGAVILYLRDDTFFVKE